MLKSLSVLFSFLFVVPLATAEVFKCVGKGGEDLYQNFPCQLESVVWTPQDNAPASRKSLAVPNDGQVSTKSAAVSQDAKASKKPPAIFAEPNLGMTGDEVRAAWGEPTEMVQQEPGNGPRFEVWSYGPSRSVRFDRRGRVSAIQK